MAWFVLELGGHLYMVPQKNRKIGPVPSANRVLTECAVRQPCLLYLFQDSELYGPNHVSFREKTEVRVMRAKPLKRTVENLGCVHVGLPR